jgi:hypothetical protein
MKNKEFLKYIKKVISFIECDEKTKKLIQEDLYTNMSVKSEELNEADPVKLMGDPNEVAREFIYNMDLKESTGFEYQTNIKILGLPLIHINFKPSGKAKGIFAMGNIAIGLIAVGKVAIGAISFGAISISLLLSAGAISLSLLLSLGAVAIAYGCSFGAVAIANYYAFGAYAQAKTALGEVTNSTTFLDNSEAFTSIIENISTIKEGINEVFVRLFPTIIKHVIHIFALLGM